MRTGSDPAAVTARVAALVFAGRPPRPGEDPAADGRRPFVKICGVTEERGLRGGHRGRRRRHRAEPGARHQAGAQRGRGDRAGALRPARPPRRGRDRGWWASSPTATSTRWRRMAARIGLDAVQLHGAEPPEALARIPLPVIKALHLPAATDVVAASAEARAGVVAGVVARAEAYRAQPNLEALLLDTADPSVPGGSGRRAAVELAAAVATRVPVILAGGLDPANVADALLAVPAIGVDTAGGVEPRPALAGSPGKDPLRVALFIKRARAARLDRPTVPFGPRPVDPGLLDPDERGRWGSEPPVRWPLRARDADGRAHRPRGGLPRHPRRARVLGRAARARSPLRRSSDRALSSRPPGRRAGAAGRSDTRATCGCTSSARTSTTPAPTRSTTRSGQALLTRRLGKSRVIAETGAGQHGVATATACALLDLECVVYMGAEDIRRQAPNVLRMRALGTEVREVTSGSATLKDAINEAMRDWVTNVATTHYVLGSAVGPHPYPAARARPAAGHRRRGGDPDPRGRGPPARRRHRVRRWRLERHRPAGAVHRRARRAHRGRRGGRGGAPRRHAAALAGGSPGVLHGSRSYLLQDEDGQVEEAHSISAGLDYPGIGPQLSALFEAGRLEILSATDDEALDGVRTAHPDRGHPARARTGARHRGARRVAGGLDRARAAGRRRARAAGAVRSRRQGPRGHRRAPGAGGGH